eukprot:Platyproteum_vivax@DN4251_c0_g1_i2.p1
MLAKLSRLSLAESPPRTEKENYEAWSKECTSMVARSCSMPVYKYNLFLNLSKNHHTNLVKSPSAALLLWEFLVSAITLLPNQHFTYFGCPFRFVRSARPYKNCYQTNI